MDTKTAGLIGTIAKVIIGALGAILCLLVIAHSDDIESGKESVQKYLNGGLNVTYIAFIVAVALVLIFGVLYFVSNIKNSMGMLIGVVAFAVVLGICYAMADGGLSLDWEARGVTEDVSKLSGAGIYAVVAMLGLAVLTAVFSEVSKIIK